MLLTIAHVGQTKPAAGPKANPRSHYEALTRLYIDRILPYHPCQSEAFPSEPAFLNWLAKLHTRQPAVVTLLDSTGRLLTSTEFATWLGARRDQGAQHLVFAVGPHDGWSKAALLLTQSPPNLKLSFGPITLPHELARLVLAEQLYRACTILQGHPYHNGH